VTRIPFPPEPAVAGNGSILAVEHASYLFVVRTDGSPASVVELAFEPGVVAVSPSGTFIAAAGEGRFALVRGADATIEADAAIGIEEPFHLVVTDSGAVYGDDAGLVLRIDAHGSPATAEVPASPGEGLIAVDGATALVWDSDGAVTVAGFGAEPSGPLDLDGEAIDTALQVGGRVGLIRWPQLAVGVADADGSWATVASTDIGTGERAAASSSGRFVVVASVTWDGDTDRLAFRRIDLTTGESSDFAADGVSPDVQFVVDDEGSVILVEGAIRPMRVSARRLGDPSTRLADVDIDALLDDLP
jgi:hypothetical protein